MPSALTMMPRLPWEVPATIHTYKAMFNTQKLGMQIDTATLRNQEPKQCHLGSHLVMPLNVGTYIQAIILTSFMYSNQHEHVLKHLLE